MLLSIIVTTFFLSLTINIVLKRFDLPTIIGYIFTGTAVAYMFGIHDAVQSHELKEIAEFGVVFLMFTIGLEFSVSHLKQMRYEVFVAGTLQIVITAGLAYGIGYYLLGLEQTLAIVLSLAVSLSSTAIVLKTFNENGEIYKRHGHRALGILIMQDIAVIPILLLLGFLGSSEGSIGEVLAKTALDAVLLLSVLFVIGKYLLEPFFIEITKTNSDELFVGSILFLAIGASFLAHEFGFSYSLGAFIAGMLISETKFRHQAEADLIPFRDLLLGVFFITVGMQIDFGVIVDNLLFVGLLLIAVMALKFTVIFTVVRLRDNSRVAFKTALSLIQIGEFSLAVLELARVGGLVGPPYGQIMIVTIVISMVLTPLILKNLSPLTERLMGQEEEGEEVAPDYRGLDEHVVILGYGEFGRSIAQALKAVAQPYCIIENNINTYHIGQQENEPIIFGNALKKPILQGASIDKASRIIIAIDNARKLRQACETIAHYVDREKIIIKVHSEREKRLIDDLGIENVVIENSETANAVKALVVGH